MKQKIKTLLAHAGFRKYFANTSWLMADKVLRLVVGLFVGVYVARYLGPDRYGLLNYAMSFVALFGAFAKLGLDNIVVRNAVQEPAKQGELLGTAFGLRLIGGLVLIILVYIVISFTEDDPYTRMLVMIIACGHLVQSVQVFEYYFRAHVMAKFVSYAYIAGLLVSSLVKLTLIWISAPLLPFAIVFVIEWCVKGLLLLILYEKNKVDVKRWRFQLRQAKQLLSDSWPLIFSGLVVMIYMKIDQVMIKNMLDTNAVGQYAAAVRISEAWYFIPTVITNSFFPAILNAKKASPKKYLYRLSSLYTLVIWLSIIIALPVTFFGNSIISLLYGVQYIDAGQVLSLHIWSGLFMSLGVSSSKWIISENIIKYSFYRTLCGAFINVSMNFIMIPTYGIVGAAVSTLFSQAFAAYFFDIFTKKTRLTFILKTKALFFMK